MAAKRILIVNVLGLLQGVIEGIVAGGDGLEVVGEVSTGEALAAVAALGPEVVLLGDDDEDDADGSSIAAVLARLKARYPALRLVSMDPLGREATLHAPGAAPRKLANPSPQSLLQLLRGLDG